MKKQVKVSDGSYDVLKRIKASSGATYEKIIDLALYNFTSTEDYKRLMLFSKGE